MLKTQAFKGIKVPVFSGWQPVEKPYRGNYGCVVIYQDSISPAKKKAVKILHKYLKPELVIAEGQKQRKVKSTYVVEITDIHDSHPHYIEMAYYPNKLDEYLKDAFLASSSTGLAYQTAALILWGICQGMNDAHDLVEADGGPIVHGDIKPANVLLAADFTPKLGDFGAARSLTARYIAVRGSTNWMAPELLAERHADYAHLPTKECDYFSFGTLAYVMLSGRHPFRHAHPSSLFSEEDNIRNPAFTVPDLNPSLSGTPDNVCNLVKLLLSWDPRQRQQAFRNLKIALSEAGAAIPIPPEQPTTAVAPPAETIARPSLTDSEMTKLQDSYERAREHFFVQFDPRSAVKLLTDLLDSLNWQRFKDSQNEALADCWSLVAFIKNSSGRYAEADEAATNGLGVYPNHFNSLFARGYAGAQSGRATKAIEDLKKALELTSDAEKRAKIQRLLDSLETAHGFSGVL